MINNVVNKTIKIAVKIAGKAEEQIKKASQETRNKHQRTRKRRNAFDEENC